MSGTRSPVGSARRRLLLAAMMAPAAAIVPLRARAGAQVEEPLAYLAVGSALWFAFLSSGIHATIAGVIAAFTIPAVVRLRPLGSAYISVASGWRR